MLLKADIERRFEKCTLEVQQLHECVAKILVTTTKMQDQTVARAANMSATSTDKQKGSSRTRRSRRGESASRATSEKPRSDPIHFADAPYMAPNSVNPEASDSKNAFGDGQVKVAEDLVCVAATSLLATPALGRDGRTRSQGRYTSERDAKRLQQNAAQTDKRPIASHNAANSSSQFQAHMFPAVMGGGSSDLTLISSSRGMKTGVTARLDPYSEGVAAQGLARTVALPLPPAVSCPCPPTSLPPGWEELTDAGTGRKYCVNLVTHSTRWDRPYYISRSEPSSGRTGDLASSPSTVRMPGSCSQARGDSTSGKASGKPFLRDIRGGKSTLVVIRRGADKR
jgi:hypothetical protein